MPVNDWQPYVDALSPILTRARRDVHGVRGASGNQCRKARLTDALLREHVAGGTRRGVYFGQPGSPHVQLALFDLDSHQGKTPWPDMQAAALAIITEAETRGLRPIPFRSSGGAGIHVYVLWDTPQDARSVRVLLRAALAAAGFEDGTGGVAARQVEVFPKQDVCSDFGHMVLLPLGGQSVPLDPFELDDMPREWILSMEWQASRPVPAAPPETREAITPPAAPIGYAHVASMVDAIPNAGVDELPYESGPDGRDYLSLIIAIHRACHGSEDGRALAHRLAARSTKYNSADIEKRYDSVTDRDGGITVSTLEAAARHYGWGAPNADEFDALPAETSGRGRPRYVRDKQGKIEATADNTSTAIRDPLEVGFDIRWDQFRAELMLSRPGADEWRTFSDEDYTRLQIQLERIGFKKAPKELVRDAVSLVAHEQQFDTAQAWLQLLRHDGEARIDTFLPRYMGAADTPYSRAVSRYMWTALAGRVLEPGCEAPMVPVLIGAQGIGKTRAVKALAPAPDFYTELNLADRDAEASRRMRGRLVIELGELRGLHSRDAESIKAFISRTNEEWRALYKEFNTTFARRFLFVGTTNQDEFLDDDSGERRWLPVSVQLCDVDAVRRDCLQLWAEARDTFELVGIDWRDAEVLARAVHAQHKIADPWMPIIAQWLVMSDEFDGGQIPGTREFLQIHEVALGALSLDAKRLGKREEMRIGKCLQGLGYSRARRYDGSRRIRVWEKVSGTV
ncbi:virulence protein E [Burkholderia lata]|uniref:VapE domain-containing protein n=1 Tax=Burkholderia lata (strain ATCC 17760 / DSM 23089 / LMG 22485 / NCIMB 9086 / R18194 / 383) TaxID=482957 RepID=UPI001454042D|nr:VapE domain-containing protein [Burkholderia lata]VWC01215.1 virulence protein E [Burkholderia lata]